MINPLNQHSPAIPVNDPVYYNSHKAENVESNIEYSGSTPSFISYNFHNPSTFIGRPPLRSSSNYYPVNRRPIITHNSKPIYETEFDGEFKDHNKFVNKKEIVVQTDVGIQQHIHHHFHHSNANKGIMSPVIELGSTENNAFNKYGYQNDDRLYNYQKDDKKKGVIHDNSFLRGTKNFNYAERYLQYENPKRDFLLNKNKFNNNYENDRFQKINGFNLNNNFGSNNEFGQNIAISNILSETNYNDCVCVLREKCIMLDQAGRKEDLYLSLDPRSLDKNITADTKDIIEVSNTDKINVSSSTKQINGTTKFENQKKKEIELSDLYKIKGNETIAENIYIKSFDNLRARRNIYKSLNNKEEINQTQSVSYFRFYFK
jgi:hypothetical protein